MKTQFPGTDLWVNPNIISKSAGMKKNYYSLQNILSQSGVGFNLKGDHMIDCDDDQWEHIVKADAVQVMAILQDWKEIFGRVRATGENAKDIMEVVNDLLNKDKLGKAPAEDDHYRVSLEDMFTNEAAEDSVCGGQKDDEMHTQRGKRRKVPDGMQSVCDLLIQIHRETSARLEKMSTHMGYEFDLTKVRKEVFELLGSISGLSLDRKFDVWKILAKEVDRLDILMGLLDSARP